MLLGEFKCLSALILAGNHEDRVAFERLLEDFDGLARGEGAGGEVVAPDGRRIWKFVLLVFKADEEVRANELGMPHFNSPECCSDCLANATTRPIHGPARGGDVAGNGGTVG